MDENHFHGIERKIKRIKIECFIINKGNIRIFEYLKNKKIQEKPSKVYSVTKSIVSILVGIMVDRGLVNDIHTPITKYFPELLTSREQWKKEITIYHLLTMTSGLQVAQFQGSKNWVETILTQSCIYKPGSTFQYNSGDSHLLSVIIRKISGLTTAMFAEEHLFRPIGVNKYIWVTDPQGNNGGGFSLSLSLEDMMKVGSLLLNRGKFSNQQMISTSWLEEAQRPHKQVETVEFGTYGYGYQFWTFRSSGLGKPINYYCASGLFGQYIFIVPEFQIVAVVKSRLQDEDQSLPRKFFEEFLRQL